ncbi:hypothetical protein Tco_0525152 [Tanacetum coccineum]
MDRNVRTGTTRTMFAGLLLPTTLAEDSQYCMAILHRMQPQVVSSTSLSKKIATKKNHSPRQPSSTLISKSAEDIMTFRNELDALALKHLGPVPTTVSTSTNPVNTCSINLNTVNTEAISPSADHEEEVFSDADDDEMPEIRI